MTICVVLMSSVRINSSPFAFLLQPMQLKRKQFTARAQNALLWYLTYQWCELYRHLLARHVCRCLCVRRCVEKGIKGKIWWQTQIRQRRSERRSGSFGCFKEVQISPQLCSSAATSACGGKAAAAHILCGNESQNSASFPPTSTTWKER